MYLYFFINLLDLSKWLGSCIRHSNFYDQKTVFFSNLAPLLECQNPEVKLVFTKEETIVLIKQIFQKKTLKHLGLSFYWRKIFF